MRILKFVNKAFSTVPGRRLFLWHVVVRMVSLWRKKLPNLLQVHRGLGRPPLHLSTLRSPSARFPTCKTRAVVKLLRSYPAAPFRDFTTDRGAGSGL